MQRMRGFAARPRRSRPDAASLRRRELRLGVAGAVLVVAVLAAVGVLYVVPFGRSTYTADLSEAQSVRVGDDVRVAGVPVGSVKSLTLQRDRVTMTFTVDSSVFLGDQTTMDVRMLTVVGGHYIAVFPAGDRPLGRGVIPADRVRLPYSLARSFQDAAAPVAAVDGDLVRRNLSGLADALEAGPGALRDTLDGVDRFLDLLLRQRTEVSKAISIAEEYLSGVDTAKGELRRLIDKINVLETVLSAKRSETRTALLTLNRVIARLAALQPAWESTLEPMAQRLVAVVPELEALGSQLDSLLDSVHGLASSLTALLTPDGGVAVDGSRQTVPLDPAALAPVCVPVFGQVC
ncbi:MlaD family protein [Nocardia sp. NPDC055321]